MPDIPEHIHEAARPLCPNNDTFHKNFAASMPGRCSDCQRIAAAIHAETQPLVEALRGLLTHDLMISAGMTEVRAFAANLKTARDLLEKYPHA